MPASRRSASAVLAVVATVLIALLATAPGALARAIPWGEGCQAPIAGQARTSATCAAQLREGRALVPAKAPAAVKAAIRSANEIAGLPYVWGGGHVSFVDRRGYDCSGAVGYALHGGNMLSTTMVSGQLASWGLPGPGRWITVYANAQHVFMVIAGLRFDTRTPPVGVTGPRWHTFMVESRGFTARHPAGL